MPSLDFVYDITERLDEEKIDYLVLTIREGAREDKVDVFFRIKEESEEVFSASIDRVKEIIATRDDDKAQKPPRKAPKKRAKKRKRKPE
tara:strand:- start:7062 stop:7328 length:267 start_codon:yes stop_codon:yes gene_type:complete